MTPGLAHVVCVVLLVVGGAEQQVADVQPMAPPPSSMTLTPPKLDFGTQSVGVSSQPMAATLTNIGREPVTILDITASGIDFTEKDQCQGTLAPQANCSLEATFTPAITGPRMGTVVITTSEAPHTLFLLLTGNGV